MQMLGMLPPLVAGLFEKIIKYLILYGNMDKQCAHAERARVLSLFFARLCVFFSVISTLGAGWIVRAECGVSVHRIIFHSGRTRHCRVVIVMANGIIKRFSVYRLIELDDNGFGRGPESGRTYSFA